jgi:hypothetical protein
MHSFSDIDTSSMLEVVPVSMNSELTTFLLRKVLFQVVRSSAALGRSCMR